MVTDSRDQRDGVKTRGVTRTSDERARTIAAAAITAQRHECDACRAGRPCEAAVLAHDVLALVDILEETVAEAADDRRLGRAHQEGRREAVAQALAVIGRAEGDLRSEANGDAHHPAFAMAESLRHLGLTIRLEVNDPESPTTLEVMARAAEAGELSEYVRGVSAQYRDSQSEVAAVLDNVAGDIAKGTQGVSRLLQASNIDTPVEVLHELAFDADADIRWWAAQNPTTSVDTLVEAIASERHPTVLTALLLNPRLPDRLVEFYTHYSNHEVSSIARRRLQAAQA